MGPVRAGQEIQLFWARGGKFPQACQQSAQNSPLGVWQSLNPGPFNKKEHMVRYLRPIHIGLSLIVILQ
jgi:hypothetical protein